MSEIGERPLRSHEKTKTPQLLLLACSDNSLSPAPKPQSFLTPTALGKQGGLRRSVAGAWWAPSLSSEAPRGGHGAPATLQIGRSLSPRPPSPNRPKLNEMSLKTSPCFFWSASAILLLDFVVLSPRGRHGAVGSQGGQKDFPGGPGPNPLHPASPTTTRFISRPQVKECFGYFSLHAVKHMQSAGGPDLSLPVKAFQRTEQGYNPQANTFSWIQRHAWADIRKAPQTVPFSAGCLLQLEHDR